MNTTIISSFSNPVESPWGAKRCSRKPIGPLAWIAQTVQQAKKIRDMANVMLRSALASRSNGSETRNPC